MSARLRPIRSAMNPKSKPPIPEAKSVSVARNPETALLMFKSRITWASTSA